MAIEKYIIDKSDLNALLKGEVLAIQPKGNIRGFCVEITGNLTNGDVIKAMFPNAITRIFKNTDFTYIEVEQNDKWIADFDIEWWNAPY